MFLISPQVPPTQRILFGAVYFCRFPFSFSLFIATHCSGHEAGRALSDDRRRTSARVCVRSGCVWVRSASPLTKILLFLLLLLLLSALVNTNFSIVS